MLKFASLALLGVAAAKISVDKDTRTFRDETGRARIFHGQNVVVKLPSYIPSQGEFDYQMSLNDEDLTYLREWGTKIIRLGVMWEAVETAPGVYDDAYLDAIDALITKIGSYGMHTIVDMHQDLFSRKLCGEGVPSFYTPEDLEDACPDTLIGRAFHLAGECASIASYNFTLDADGNPLTEECGQQNFQTLYTAPEVTDAFDALYTNRDGLQDKFMAYWSKLAGRFAANDFVIGYDILNEPWPANIYHETNLFLKPQTFDREKLYPMSQRANGVVREQDTAGIIFFEPAQFPDTLPFFGGMVYPMGFPDSPGGAADIQQAVNDHSYCCQMDATACETGEPPLSISDKCRAFHFDKAAVRAADAARYGTPMMFTEFGACFNSVECATEITNAADAYDSQLASWAYWMYKGYGDFTTTGGAAEGMFNEDGTPQDEKLRAISRTYVHAFKGTPESMYFSSKTGAFQASFLFDRNVAGDTELYLNQDLWYPNGFKLTFADKAKLKTLDGMTRYFVDSQWNYFGWQFFDDFQYNGKSVQILLTQPLSDDALSGVASAGEYQIEWGYEDTGANPTCEFDIHWDAAVPQTVELHIVDKEHKSMQRWISSKKKTSKTFNCADLIDARLSLIETTNSWFSVSKEIGGFDLDGLNGHKVSLSIDLAPSSAAATTPLQ